MRCRAVGPDCSTDYLMAPVLLACFFDFARSLAASLAALRSLLLGAFGASLLSSFPPAALYLSAIYARLVVSLLRSLRPTPSSVGLLPARVFPSAGCRGLGSRRRLLTFRNHCGRRRSAVACLLAQYLAHVCPPRLTYVLRSALSSYVPRSVLSRLVLIAGAPVWRASCSRRMHSLVRRRRGCPTSRVMRVSQ